MTFRLYPVLLAILCISLFFSFSCTTDIDLPPPPGNYSSSGLPAGTVFCDIGTACSAMASEICTAVGGHPVASCPDVSSSSSTLSSSSKISSSSSRASSSSSSLPTGTVFCKVGTNCGEMDSEICGILGGSVVSSCSIKRSVVFEVRNSYGAGWGPNYLRINVNGSTNKYIALDNGYSDYYLFDFNVGDVIRVYWVGDVYGYPDPDEDPYYYYSYPQYCSFTVYYDDNGRKIMDSGTLPWTDEILVDSFTVAAP